MIRVIHLAQDGTLVAWCGLRSAAPASLTYLADRATCRACLRLARRLSAGGGR